MLGIRINRLGPARRPVSSYVARPAARSTVDLTVTDFTASGTTVLSHLSQASATETNDQGQAAAFKYRETASGTVAHAILISKALAVQTYQLDVIVKADGRNRVLINLSGISKYGIFDLVGETLAVNSGLTSGSVLAMTGGWKCCSLIFTGSVAVNDIEVWTADDANGFVIASDTNKGYQLAMVRLSHN